MKHYPGASGNVIECSHTITTCPACQRDVLEDRQDCPYCGVVFKKWRPHLVSIRAERMPQQQTLKSENHPAASRLESVLTEKAPATVSRLMNGCPVCGGKISPNAVWCSHCGHPIKVKWTLPEMERVNPSPRATITRLITYLGLGLILFMGYHEWNQRQVKTSPASVPVRISSLPTIMPATPAETQPPQPMQPIQPTMALSNPQDQLPPPLQTSRAPVDDHKIDDQGEKPKLSRYEIPFEAYEGTAKRIIISVTFNDFVTAPMALDTGSPGMMISPKLAKKLGVFSGDEGTLVIEAGGIGGSVPAILTIIDKVQVGGASDSFIPTTVARSISGSFEGLIGMDFMAKYSITVDHKKKVLVFEELPPDPNSPGGHDEQWWRNTFQEFNNFRDYLRKYEEAVDKRIMTTPFGGDGRYDSFKKAIEWQSTQADKLLGKLEHYAGENYVPREWR
jgi:hypothetical protein